MPRLSASVVVYGGAEDAIKCVSSICQYTASEDFMLYLVDNHSPDGALHILKSKVFSSCVNIIGLPKNIGFGPGHNIVLQQLNSQYHAVINPDIEINEDVLNKMADWMDEHPDVVITTPRLHFPSGEEQFIAKRRPTFMALLARQIPLSILRKYEDNYLMLNEDLSKPIEVEFCSGSFFLIRTDIYKKMGGFDEDYFMYVEDADITQKALQYGKAYYLPQVSVTHAWNRATHRSIKAFIQQLKSMGLYFKKWGFRFK